MNAEYFTLQNGVYISEQLPDSDFEELYLSVREKEQRIFSDVELINLPEVPPGHKYHDEWAIRKASCKRLIKCLNKKDRFLNILEIGCGNGWLSHRLAEIPRKEIIWLEINLKELEQAAQVFPNHNLKFVYGDLRKNILQNRR